MRLSFFLLFTAFVASLPLRSQDKPAGPALPQTDAGKHVGAYLKAFNEPDPAAMASFFSQHTAKDALADAPVEQRMSRYYQMKQRLGSLRLTKLLGASEESVSIEAASAHGEALQLDFLFEPRAPHGLLGIRVQDLGTGEREQPVGKSAASDTDLVRATSSLLDSLSRSDEFSGVVLIAKQGSILFEHAYGFADRDRKTPNNLETKFNLGSINKRFTKTAIDQLASAGKLALSDHIKKFLPDYPNKDAAEKVTIRQLLDMQSGIGDFFGERYLRTPKERLQSISDYLPLFADKPLEFEPGTSQRYSNGGYIVLGAIIEKASGKDYYSFVRENIFHPAGMFDTDAFGKDASTPNRALGYTRTGTGKEKWGSNYATLPGKGSSAGGGYSTVHDLLRFVAALEKGTLPTPDTEDGLGIAGGAPGLNAALEWDRESGYAVIVLSNFDPPSAERVARQIRAWLPK